MDLPPPLANIVTLGVRNLDTERDFYRALGWPVVSDSDDFVVFELRGALLAIFPVDQLGADAHVEPELGRGGIRSAVIISADHPDEVDDWVNRAQRAGASITKQPTAAQFFDGRDAYFADPEGNYWEVAWAPPDNPVAAAARRVAGIEP